MPQDRPAIVQAIQRFCAAHPSWVLFDEQSGTLLDVGVAKQLAVPMREAVEAVERTNAQTGMPYLLVELGDGRQLALSDAGIAFPPVAAELPNAPPLPPVVCLRDFGSVRAQLEHMVFGHPGQKPTRDALDLVALALGVLGGASRMGFDISDEERALDGILAEMEKR